MNFKDGLRLVVARAREREAAELLPLCNDLPPERPGRWTVRDTLAHLTAWRLHAAAVLQAAASGGAEPEPVDDIDGENAAIYAAARGLPAAAVIEASEASWDSLASSIEGCSESVLTSPRKRRPEQQVWETVPGNAHAHLAEHLGYLAEERGDPVGAEQAARWAHDLDLEAFRGDRQRGNADYNLACYFAKRRRSDDALPLLKSAFTLNPDLKSWAHKDSDLDPVRTVAEIAGLLR